MRIETDRLLLRPWLRADHEAWAAINADPEIRRYYWPSIQSRSESDAVIVACEQALDEQGFGFVAVERQADHALIGGIGFSWTDEEIPGGRQIEIGWIFGQQYWGQGYAFEAATACLAWAPGRLPALQAIGYTSEINTPSRRLMEKLGMRRDPAEDFDDITVPEGNPLRPHVLYRLEL